MIIRNARMSLLALTIFFLATAYALSQSDDASLSTDTTVTSDSSTTSDTLATSDTLLEPPSPNANNYDILGYNIGCVIAKNLTPSRVGAYVIDVDSQVVALAHNSDSNFPPGETQNLITTAAALDRLGSRFRFRTTLKASGVTRGDELLGDLVVSGGGDPTFESRYCSGSEDKMAIFKEWYGELERFGIRKISGRVVGDGAIFDDERVLTSWPLESRGEERVAEVSGLCFNDNVVDIFFKAGRALRKKTDYVTLPNTEYVRISNEIISLDAKVKPEVGFDRQEGSDVILAHGRIPRKTEFHARATIDNPSRYCATVFREALLGMKFNVKGTACDIRDITSTSDTLSTATWPVAMHLSPPLGEIVRVTNTFGRGLYADCLIKMLGVKFGEGGSFSEGCNVISDFLREIELGSSGALLVDGSGVSSQDSVSPGLMAALLAKMSKHKEAKPFIASIPNPGVEGLMSGRFADLCAKSPEVAGRIRAVSGDTMGTYSLVGYAETEEGVRFAFAFMINDPGIGPEKAEGILEEMATLVARAPIRKY
jgi:D-alanyl-D-alanine carboxypeptidase/D-alanyl-D-alanine-endopeptidase (penicillin-binding protein 4)